MEDDIFLQLSNLLEGNPTASGGTVSGTSTPFYGAEDSSMFQKDMLVTPDTRPRRPDTGRRNVVIIDDDFSTLDLMKIYLQRDYDVEVFDNPKNAIFYLNGVVPDLIFIDCYLDIMSTKKVIGIIRTYKELVNVPIVYLAEPSEQAAIESKLPEGVVDIISRPVKRADLQRMLETYIVEEEDDGSEDDGSEDNASSIS